MRYCMYALHLMFALCTRIRLSIIETFEFMSYCIFYLEGFEAALGLGSSLSDPSALSSTRTVGIKRMGHGFCENASGSKDDQGPRTIIQQHHLPRQRKKGHLGARTEILSKWSTSAVYSARSRLTLTCRPQYRAVPRYCVNATSSARCAIFV